MHAIFHSKQSLGILRCHAEDTREPAPQHGTRAAEGNGSSHADNVARADGGSKGGGKGSELANVALGMVVTGYRQANAGEQTQLRNAETEGKEKMCAKKQHNHRPTP